MSCPNDTKQYSFKSNQRCCPPGGIVNIEETSGCTIEKTNDGIMHCALGSESGVGGCKTIPKCDSVSRIIRGPQGKSGTTELSTNVIAKTIYTKAKYISVSLMMNTGNATFSGSGFFIERHNKIYICTVAHNVMNGDRNNFVDTVYASINRENKPPIFVECEVLGVGGAADVAVLKCNENIDDLPYSKFETEPIETGGRCFIVGDPLGADAISVVDGIIRDAKYIQGNIIESVAVSAPIQSGNSGSGIMNDKGNIIGIVSYAHGENETFGWGCSCTLMKPITDHIIDSYNTTGIKPSHYIGGIIENEMYPVDALYLNIIGKNPYTLEGYYFNSYNNGWSPYIIVKSINNKNKILGVYDNQHTPSIIYTLPRTNLRLELVSAINPSYTRTIYRTPRLLTTQEDRPLGSGSSNIKRVEPVTQNRNKLAKIKHTRKGFLWR